MADIPIVVCAADDRYAMPLATMLRSLADTLRKYPTVQVWVLDGGVTRRNKRRIVRSLPSGVVKLRWVRPSHRQLKGVPVFGHVSICTYYRLVIGEVLPSSIRRVIYLDVDTLVMGDIGDLWDVELDTNTLAAVPHPGVKVSDPYGLDMYEELGLPPDAPYFNAGVLLIDLDRWRMMKVGALAASFVTKYCRRLHFWDQDVLNGVLAHSWGVLDAGWNVCVSHLWQGDVAKLTNHNGRPFIIHFASSIKPWEYDAGHPAEQMYFQMMDLTEWCGWRPAKPRFNWRKINANLKNVHWYGYWIRKTPGLGMIWESGMNWIKGMKSARRFH